VVFLFTPADSYYQHPQQLLPKPKNHGIPSWSTAVRRSNMKKLSLKLIAISEKVDESRIFWSAVITLFVVGYCHFIIQWLSHR
jgi:hypothetical protein